MENRLSNSSPLAKIVGSFSGILLDAYGVFWAGNQSGLLPGSKEAMAHLVAQGKIVGILSNSTQLAAKEVDKFWRWGEIHPKFSSHQPIFEGTFYTETSDLAEADFIYISIPHIKGDDQTDPLLFETEARRLIKTGLPMICPNPDMYAHEGSPPKLVVRQGSLAALYEKLGGKVYYIGKPSAEAYKAAMDRFAPHKISRASQILMVGDTPETDIRGARRFGMASALVTQTGIMADRIVQHGPAIAQDLPPSDTPDFFINRLEIV
jgi:ribonucleotide monophosphatase NagD (HAD superfamily)